VPRSPQIFSAGVSPPCRDAERGGDRRDGLAAVAGEMSSSSPRPRNAPAVSAASCAGLPHEQDRTAAPWLNAMVERTGATGSAVASRRMPDCRAALRAVDHGPHAAPGLFARTRERRAFMGFLGNRQGKRMAARKAQPAARSSKVGSTSAALATRGSGKVSVPVLSKTTVSTRRAVRSRRRHSGSHRRGTGRRRRRPHGGNASASAQGQV